MSSKHLSGSMIILLLALLLQPISLFAQDPAGAIQFSWGDSYRLPKKHIDFGFIGNEQDGYLQIGHRPGRSLSFQHFDNLLHLNGENKISLKSMPKNYQTVSFQQVGSKYYWFFCVYNKKKDEETLYSQEIDVKTGGIIGSARELYSTTRLTGDTYYTGFLSTTTYNKWRLYYSVDGKKLLVQYRKKPEIRDDSRSKDVIGFHVFDQEMTKVWGKEIRMPYTEELMDNEHYHVDKDGNVYTLAKVYNEKKGNRKKPNYRMEILRWTPESNEVMKIPFKLNDKFVNSAIMTKGFNDELMVVGYYSNIRYATSADGVFLLRLDEKSGELTNVKKGVYEFPQSVLSEFESARVRRRNERKDKNDDLEAANMVMREVFFLKDGSIQVYGEEAYVEVVVSTSYNGKTTTRTYTYHYYYNDILGMSIGADGEMTWVAKIPKQQHGINSGLSGMSYKRFAYGTNQYLFFMDNRRNNELEKDERPSEHRDGKGGELVVVKIDEKGNKSRSSIFSVREEHKNLYVTDLRKVGDGKMMGRAFRGRKSQPAFISFN